MKCYNFFWFGCRFSVRDNQPPTLGRIYWNMWVKWKLTKVFAVCAKSIPNQAGFARVWQGGQRWRWREFSARWSGNRIYEVGQPGGCRVRQDSTRAGRWWWAEEWSWVWNSSRLPGAVGMLAGFPTGTFTDRSHPHRAFSTVSVTLLSYVL